MPDVRNYVQAQMTRAPALLKSLIQDEKGKAYVTRRVFIKIQMHLNQFMRGQREARLLAIPGLRGVGKTTILAQVYFWLIGQRKEVLYVSADEIVNLINSDLYTVMREYERILGSSFEALDRDVFLLIDEVHFDSKWQALLKAIFDKSRRVFVIGTGSSALALQSTPDLARRAAFEKLFPMNFSEYMLLHTNIDSEKDDKYPIKGIGQGMAQALFDSRNAKECFDRIQEMRPAMDRYWATIDPLEIDRFIKTGTLPFALRFREDAEVFRRTLNLLEKVTSIDLSETKRFGQETLAKARSALLMLASNDQTSVTGMANTLQMEANTLFALLEALETAEILLRVYPYGPAESKVRKPSKYCFGSPLLRLSLLSVIGGRGVYDSQKGKLLEDLVAAAIYRLYGSALTAPLQYDSQQGGADFIVSLRRKVVLEIGWGSKSHRQVHQTMQKVKADYGLTICSDELSIDESARMVRLPLKYFLLI